MNKIALSFVVLEVLGLSAEAVESLNLTRDGQVAAEVVVAADAPRPVAFAKRELERYLGILATNAVGKAKSKGEVEQRKVSVSVSVDAGNAELEKDGYVIEANAKGVRIVGKDPRGALYGTYELLRRHGGLRWLTPEPEGEYFTLKGDMRVPYGRLVRNPRLKQRQVAGYGCDWRFYDWLARNGMFSTASHDAFVNADDTRREKVCDMVEDRAVPAAGHGGHVVCELMYGEFNWTNGKGERTGRLDRLFKEHPNWFPLVKGKRVTWYANPCLQDPALFDHMAKNLLVQLRRPHGNDDWTLIGNNDTTVWCECEKCKAMDDVAMTAKRGVLANRYWYMVNEIARRVWKEMPEAELGGWAYQNFWYPPTKTKIDPRLRVVISFNNQCWRHAVTDPTCDANRWMLDVYRAWRQTGLKFVANRDEISCYPSPGRSFSPVEDVLVRNLRDSPSFGCAGSSLCVYGLFPRTLNFAEANGFPYYGKNLSWYAIWQAIYAASQISWDADCDIEAILEEANALYYGAGWAGGMREFRALQKNCYYSAPSCIGWGTGNTVGDVMNVPGSEEKLKDCLERALAAARKDPDPRAAVNVARAKEMFEMTWVCERRKYLNVPREPVAYVRKGRIDLDGVLDEPDWKDAAWCSDFRLADTNRVATPCGVKIVHDPDGLYVAGSVVAGARPAKSDRIELMLAPAGRGAMPKTVVIGADGSISSGQVKMVRTKDGWSFEAFLPSRALEWEIRTGETWHFGLVRRLAFADRSAEVSTFACGLPRAGKAPLYLLLAEKRPEGLLCHSVQMTGARWKNPGFSCTRKNPGKAPYRWAKWRGEAIPEDWGQEGADGELLSENGNAYVRLRAGSIGQNFANPGGGDVKLVLRVRGQGKAAVKMLTYDGGVSGLIKDSYKTPVFELTTDWQTVELPVKGYGKAGENVSFSIYPVGKDSRLDMDEVVPVSEKGSLNLTRDGKVAAEIVVPADAPRPVAFAKRELEKYLGILATNAVGEPKSKGEGEQRKVSVSISVDEKNPELKEDGFVIEADAQGVRIVGQNPRGALYGAYEILRRYGGIRWLAPGDDCEYFTRKGDVVVPHGRSVQNPDLKVRKTISTDALWHARNNMQTVVNADWFYGKDGKTVGEAGRKLEDMAVMGEGLGGHVMCELLYGQFNWDSPARQKRLDDMYARHPEWFPLVGGKRVTTYANPCVSNEALLDHMASNYVAVLRREHVFDSPVLIGNNDTTVWCECEKCRALDAPEAKGTRGERSDRYWYMVNGLARRVWKVLPEAKFSAWAYQDFWYPPRHVKPDPRIQVVISYNNQCWRHAVDDPKCPVNAKFRDIYLSWKRAGVTNVVNRDEIGAWDGNGSPGCEFLPTETVLPRNFAAYPAIGCCGSSFCVNTPYPEFSDFAKKWAPYHGHRYHWWAMWQTCYVSALTMWNAKADWKPALEEANRLYYGAAWENGMREFRELLAKCFFSVDGCIGWGLGLSTGPCLDAPGSEERLVALIDRAVAAAKSSGDARALKHVARERTIFEMTWRKSRKNYLENYREMTGRMRTGEIRVDGVLDERNWAEASAYTDFREPNWVEEKDRNKDLKQTSVRVLWDAETLYVAVEAMEPRPEKIVAGDKVFRDAVDCDTLGDHVELFYSYPDMSGACWQMMINSKGQIIESYNRSSTDRDTKVRTRAKWATKVGADRWTLEIAIPTSEIGQNIFDGANWRLNVARIRKVAGEKDEMSSAAGSGVFHGNESYPVLRFRK